MKKYNYIAVAIFLVLILSGVVYAKGLIPKQAQNNVSTDSNVKTSQVQVDTSTGKIVSETSDLNKDVSETAEKSTETSAEPQTTIPKPNQTTSQTTKTVETLSGYTDYDESKLSNAKYGRVVLFFHASWCPSCRGLETDIRNNLSQIPKDMLIMKVDFDSSTALKNKYRVVQQHTLVQVDENGELIKSNKGLYQLNTLNSVLETFSR